MTSKQRAYLKSLAMKLEPVMQIGKATLTPEVTKAVNDVLEARELIKINVLKNCIADTNDMAHILAERTQAEVVQVIGKKIILYRKSESVPEAKRIILPAAAGRKKK